MKTIYETAKRVLRERRYAIGFALLIPVKASFLFLLPVWLTPGNSVSFQASLFRPQDWALTALLAVAIALTLTVHVYAFARAKSVGARAGSVGGAAAGGFAGVMGAMFATASCAWCVAAIFGFLGTGGILFLIQQRTSVTVIAILLMLASLYAISRKIARTCTTCERPA